MVSFTCNHCQDVVKKPKVQTHANTCGSHSFTCVDCMHVFDLDTIKVHTSCVTEEDKYQGKWKQKLNSSNNRSGEPPRGMERPPRAPMNDLSSSDESNDDWVKKPGSKPAESEKKAVAGPARGKKHPHPGVSPSSDDDDDESNETRKAPPTKKAKTMRSVSVTPKATPAPAPHSQKKSKSQVPYPKDIAVAAASEEEAMRPEKKDTPLLLPRSTTSTECIVPSFVLGTSAEVADIVRDVLAEQGVSSLRSKDLALALVDRYTKRIAKSVRHAVDTAVELGALKMEKNGNVALA